MSFDKFIGFYLLYIYKLMAINKLVAIISHKPCIITKIVLHSKVGLAVASAVLKYCGFESHTGQLFM